MELCPANTGTVADVPASPPRTDGGKLAATFETSLGLREGPAFGSILAETLGDMDYEEEDKLDTRRFKTGLWKGMMGNKPYPKHRSGQNLRENRAALLSAYE